MDLNKLTKSELITTVEELTKNLASHSHLAEAVDAKDREIHKVEKEKKEAIALLEKNRAEEIQKIKESFEKKESSLNYEIQDLRGKIQQNEDFDKVIEQNKKLVSEVQRLGNFINGYTQSFRNFMKGIQGTLDNTIELESILVETLQKN